MKLSQYLKSLDQSVRSFAKKCNLSDDKIHFVLQEKRNVPLKTALIIERMTNGDVSMVELCDQDFQEKLKTIESPFKKLKRKD